MLRARPAALWIAAFVLPAALLPSAPAFGQGLLVNEQADQRIRLPRPWVRPTPQPPAGTYKVEQIAINGTINDQVAKIQVSQKFRNTGSRQMEVAFVFPLPYDGAIDQLTLLVDGKEFEGKLLPADQAREMYEAIVRKNQDPALLEWVGQGLFRTSVFPVPAGAERTVTLRYTQLLRKAGNLTDFTFPLSTAKYTSEPIDKLSVRLTIESKSPLTNLYSPSHALKVERPNGNRAVVSHSAEKTLPSEDFRLFFDTATEGLAASLVSYRPSPGDPGYFLMLASPQLEAVAGPPPAKTVLFVVDRSGSMSGAKMDQAKGALRFVLNNLREGDTFNVIAYDNQVESFRPELQRVDDSTRSAAMAFVDSLYAGGSTNIDGALERAFSMLDDSARPTYVMFLTDGLPTAGEKNEAKIVEHTKRANEVRARVFAFGVGYDVNSRLLDRLGNANFGQSEYVRPDEDIEASVARLYSRIGTPVLTNVRLAIDVEGTSDGVSGLYPRGSFDLFAGDQVVIVGRYAQHGSAKATLSGTLRGEEKTYDFPAEMVEVSQDDTNSFIGRLWAIRRVGEIIDEIDLNGQNQELVNELVALATHHGIVTQYTSFMADETADHNALADNHTRARGQLAQGLNRTTDSFGFRQRASKQHLRNAARPAEAAPAPASGPRGGIAGSTREGLERAARELQLGRAAGNAYFYDADGDRSRVAWNIRNVGRKTFFNRNTKGRSVWCDSTVDAAEELNAQPIERYSREYFDLIANHGRHVAQYLAIDEPVVIKLGGQVYTW